MGEDDKVVEEMSSDVALSQAWGGDVHTARVQGLLRTGGNLNGRDGCGQEERMGRGSATG